MVTSPLLSGATSPRKLIRHATTTLRPKQAVDTLTAVLLGEAGFKAQALEDAPPQPPPTPSSSLGGKKPNWSSRLSKSSTPAWVAERRRVELGAQLLLARALGGGGPAPSCSSFAVRLNSGPTPVAVAGGRASKGKGGRRSPSHHNGGDVRLSAGGNSSVGSKSGKAKRGGGSDKKSRKPCPEESEDGVLALSQEQRGGKGYCTSPRAKPAAASAAASGASDAYGGGSSVAAPDCELCVLRDEVPYRMPYIV